MTLEADVKDALERIGISGIVATQTLQVAHGKALASVADAVARVGGAADDLHVDAVGLEATLGEIKAVLAAHGTKLLELEATLAEVLGIVRGL